MGRDGTEDASSYDEAMDFQRRTVLLIEDEEAITAPLSEALTREGFALETAGTIGDGLRIARELAPSLVLLDVMLPDGSGFDALRELRATGSTPVIMLTARGDEADRVAGLELGADDYVIKPFSARELVARIRAVLRRASAAAEPARREAVRIGAVELDPASRVATLERDPLELTRKEFDLLALLMGHAGSVVTRERLIDEVWDVNWFGSTKTLDVHVSGLRKKLGDDPSNPRYLHTVRGVGFRFAAPSEVDGR
jgi:DNA-binding response OmpR family regulator